MLIGYQKAECSPNVYAFIERMHIYSSLHEKMCLHLCTALLHYYGTIPASSKLCSQSCKHCIDELCCPYLHLATLRTDFDRGELRKDVVDLSVNLAAHVSVQVDKRL